MIRRIPVHDRDADRAATLLTAASYPDSTPHAHAAQAKLTAIRALRPPTHRKLSAALLRITRAIDTETEALYRRQDNGHTDAEPALRAIAFRLLELGFTIAEHSGLNCHDIETAVAQVYGLPGYGGESPRNRIDHGISGR